MENTRCIFAVTASLMPRRRTIDVCGMYIDMVDQRSACRVSKSSAGCQCALSRVLESSVLMVTVSGASPERRRTSLRQATCCWVRLGSGAGSVTGGRSAQRDERPRVASRHSCATCASSQRRARTSGSGRPMAVHITISSRISGGTRRTADSRAVCCWIKPRNLT